MELDGKFWASLEAGGMGEEQDDLHVLIKPGHVLVRGNATDFLAVVSLTGDQSMEKFLPNFRSVPALILYSIRLPAHLQHHEAEIVQRLKQRAEREKKVMGIYVTQTLESVKVALALGLKQDSLMWSYYVPSPHMFANQAAPLSTAERATFLNCLACFVASGVGGGSLQLEVVH